jgi:hypothetical protein
MDFFVFILFIQLSIILLPLIILFVFIPPSLFHLSGPKRQLYHFSESTQIVKGQLSNFFLFSHIMTHDKALMLH